MASPVSSPNADSSQRGAAFRLQRCKTRPCAPAHGLHCGQGAPSTEPTPVKSSEAWAAISGPRESPITGYPTDNPAVVGQAHQLWVGCAFPPTAVLAPGPRCVLLPEAAAEAAAGRTHLAWGLCWAPTPGHTLLSPGLQTLSRQVQSKASQGPRETGSLIHGRGIEAEPGGGQEEVGASVGLFCILQPPRHLRHP